MIHRVFRDALAGSLCAPHGVAPPRYTFTFADHFTEPLCALARSVEAAGGLLHVLGLQDGRTAQLPFAVNGRRARAPG